MTRTRADRLHACLIWIGDNPGTTFTEIVRGAGLSKSNWYKEQILGQLQRDGFIIVTFDDSIYPGRLRYQLTETGQALHTNLILEAIENGGL